MILRDIYAFYIRFLKKEESVHDRNKPTQENQQKLCQWHWGKELIYRYRELSPVCKQMKKNPLKRIRKMLNHILWLLGRKPLDTAQIWLVPLVLKAEIKHTSIAVFLRETFIVERELKNIEMCLK